MGFVGRSIGTKKGHHGTVSKGRRTAVGKRCAATVMVGEAGKVYGAAKGRNQTVRGWELAAKKLAGSEDEGTFAPSAQTEATTVVQITNHDRPEFNPC